MMAMERLLNKRKFKLLMDGVKFSKKEIKSIEVWVRVEIIFFIVETLFWILSIFSQNVVLIFLLPFIPIIYICFFLPAHNEWWLNIKEKPFCIVKRLTCDYRYIYILSNSDHEFHLIIRLIETIPYIGIDSYFVISCIGAIFFSPFYLSVYWSIILSIPLQITICLWILIRLFLLRRLSKVFLTIAEQEENRNGIY